MLQQLMSFTVKRTKTARVSPAANAATTDVDSLVSQSLLRHVRFAPVYTVSHKTIVESVTTCLGCGGNYYVSSVTS